MSVQRTTIVTLLLGMFISPSSTSAALFGPPVTYSVNGNPTDVTSCDLDGDGFDDVLVAASSLKILWNDGTGFGSLDPAPSLPVGPNPHGVICADFDNDSDTDAILVCTGASELSVYRNDGSRNFVHVGLPLGGSFGPRGVIACDLNLDGLTDLVTANDILGVNDTYTVMLGTGAGAFQSAASSPLVGINPGGSMLCVDANSDGDLDVVIATEFSDDVTVLRGNGDGTFQEPLTLPAGDGPSTVSACDIDGDLDIDLVVSALFSENVGWLGNLGDFSFAAFQSIATIDNIKGATCYDFDRDGDADIAGDGEDVFVLLNAGAGSFDSELHFPIGMIGQGPALSIGFVNSDCLADLAFVSYSHNQLSLLFNSQLVVDFEGPASYTAGNSPVRIVSADLDNDQFPDLAVANGGQPTFQPSLTVLSNDQDGSFTSQPNISLPCTQAYAVAAGDVDGDNDIDLATVCRGGDLIFVHHNNGSANFAAPISYSGAAHPRDMLACDIDADSDLDLVVRAESEIRAFLNTGAGAFTSSIMVGNSTGSDFACADLDADGYPDISLTQPGSSAIEVWWNQGGNTFTPAGFGVGLDSRSVAVCDVTGDSIPELISADDNGISILRNLGSRSFAAAYAVGSPNRFSVNCCDVDADGDGDLLVDSSSPAFFEALVNNGQGQFQASGGFFAGDAQVCADLNRDGSNDVATPSVGVYLNRIVAPPLQFVSQPQSQVVPISSSVTFNAEAMSELDIKYQWYKDGQVIPGATAHSLVINYVDFEDAGVYYVFADGDCAKAQSESATLGVFIPVPAVSGWALLIMVLALAVAGTLVIAFQKKAKLRSALP